VRLIKIGLANVSPTVGAVDSNLRTILDLARAMDAEGVTIGAFPEQVVGGYPPEDLIQWRAFLAGQRRALGAFAEATRASKTVYVLGLAVAVDGQLFNSAAVVHGGRILGFVPKEKLPTYNVFYEGRTFSHGTAGLTLDAGGVPLGDYLFQFDFGTIGVEVCEDYWSPDGPMRRRCYSGADLVVNISSSPFRVGIAATRREMLATRSGDNQVTVAFVNAVGAQDGLVFDGGGSVMQNGRPMFEAPRFREGTSATVVDLDRTVRLRMENTTWRTDCEMFRLRHTAVPVIRSASATHDRSALQYPPPPGGSFFLPAADRSEKNPREEVLDDLFDALALGAADYFRKTGAFRTFGIALSGGRDSMLTLLVAWHAVGVLRQVEPGEARRKAAGELIQAFYMPTRFSAVDTRTAAHRLAEDLGVPLTTVAVDEAFDRELEATRAMLGGAEPNAITKQNIQARLRGQRMWNWANTAGALFLQTGDMSEKAVGYTTVGGDLEGALSVIANLPKTVVIAMLERLHARFGFPGIADTLATGPGPELAADQDAERELMPFPILDACLHLYAGEKLAPDEVAVALTSIFPDVDPATLRAHALRFATLFTQSIFKWVQAPLALHVGSLELDRERALQIPVVQKNEWNGD